MSALRESGYRVHRYLAKYGARAATGRAVGAVRQRVYLDESHVWYALPVAGDRPRVPLAETFTFRRADRREAGLIERLPTVALPEAERRLADGNELWFVFDGATPAFACWIFTERMPMLAAPGGMLTLPAGTVCLEDSVTSADHRGKGLAPAAWTLLADDLQTRGVTAMLTKVGVENAPSRRAVTKAGFGEVGLMRFRRVGPRARTTVTDAADGVGRQLAGQLTR